MPDAPELLELKQRLADLPDLLSWEHLWNFRSEVGDLMLRASPDTSSSLRIIYDDFTAKLKARAEELGKGDEFAVADRLTALMLETAGLRSALDAAGGGVRFYEILNDPARQSELTALNTLIQAGGLPADYLTARRDALKANYRIAKAGQTGEPLRLRDVLMAWVEKFRENRKRDRK